MSACMPTAASCCMIALCWPTPIGIGIGGPPGAFTMPGCVHASCCKYDNGGSGGTTASCMCAGVAAAGADGGDISAVDAA
eukprot:6515316-Alexandrium_andersonii.AAC.1